MTSPTDRSRPHHISSAVVRANPDKVSEVVEAIAGRPGAEIFHWEGDKIVVILEGPSTKAVGDCLSEIALLDGVVSANLVYEQVDTETTPGEAR